MSGCCGKLLGSHLLLKVMFVVTVISGYSSSCIYYSASMVVITACGAASSDTVDEC